MLRFLKLMGDFFWSMVVGCLLLPALAAAQDVPCAAWSYAVVANTGSVTLNAATLVDSYQSSAGPYGGQNVGSSAIVQAANVIVSNGGIVKGGQTQSSQSGFPALPIPAGATNLPLGSGSPGSLNINSAGDSITLTPGDYIAENINVSSRGAINISPVGQVRIWVTGNLNLGGNENLNGIPRNLAFVVTSSGSVNVNSGGSLYGMIYAPTSNVNVNSAVFGSVIGGSVSLNSGAGIHIDQSGFCSQVSTTGHLSGLDPLPAPPNQIGCYIGTLNGWASVPCTDPAAVLPGFHNFNTGAAGLQSISYVSGGTTQPAVPLIYGQVESTIESIGSETNGSSPNNPQWGVQSNSNFFPCDNPNADQCWVQFVLVGDGVDGVSAVCIETWQNVNSQPPPVLPTVVTHYCVTANGKTVINNNSLVTDVTTRKGSLQAGDFANVAGFAYTANGQPLIAIAAQFSWVSDQDVLKNPEPDLPNRIPGLYAVVAPDQYGLAKKWTNVTGGFLGNYNRAQAQFTNAAVFTRVAASSCQGDVSAAGPICPAQPALSANNVEYAQNPVTGETNNLTLTEPTPSVAFPNQNLAVTSFLATDNVPFPSSIATCLPNQSNHLFIKDNEGDNGGVPSNVGGIAFWESPDIFVVPQGLPAPQVNDVPADLELTAGQPYDVYLRVHNEFGCSNVNGPINVFIDAADPNMGFSNWQPITPGADAGQYTTFGSAATTIPAYGAGIIGPFPFTPGDGGHKCLLAAIAAGSESEPPASAKPPVLSPAYSSNQIAQRNVQIGSSCTYNISNTNTTTANLLFGISVTPATPAPGSSGGPAVSLVFGDPSGVWAAEWKNLPGLSSVTNDGTSTTIVLSSSYVALPSVPLAGGQSPAVTINITPADTSPTVNVSAILSDPQTGDILQQNGGSCTGTQIVIPPVK
jgi:hypothetical protein